MNEYTDGSVDVTHTLDKKYRDVVSARRMPNGLTAYESTRSDVAEELFNSGKSLMNKKASGNTFACGHWAR